MAVGTTVGNGKEMRKSGILVFLKAKGKNLEGTLKTNMTNTAYLYVNLFRSTKKFFSPLP